MSKCHLEYIIHPHFNGITGEEINKRANECLLIEGSSGFTRTLFGASNAIIMSHIDREGQIAHDGSACHSFFSCDGQNKFEQIPESEFFSVFCSMANFQLETFETLSDWQKEILEHVVNKARENILAGKGW